MIHRIFLRIKFGERRKRDWLGSGEEEVSSAVRQLRREKAVGML
jgi:hypothetical protein